MSNRKIDPFLQQLLEESGYLDKTEKSGEQTENTPNQAPEEEVLEEEPVEEVLEEEPVEESVNSNSTIRVKMISKNDHYLKQMKLYRNSGIMSGIACAGSLLSHVYTLPMDATPSTGMLRSLTIFMSALTFIRSGYCFYKTSKYNGMCTKAKEKGKVKKRIKETVDKW